MQIQKKYLEDNGWVCGPCPCQGSKGWDCISKAHKGYMIQIRASNISRIIHHGRIISSFPISSLLQKMKEFVPSLITENN